MSTSQPKVLFFDLENIQHMDHVFHPGNVARKRAAGFCSDLAYILVFGYKWLGEPAKYIVPDEEQFKRIPHNIKEIDRSLVQQAVDIMMTADVVVTWYGSAHDYKFLTGRAAAHNINLPQNIPHIDLYKVASKQLSLSSNRLDNVAKLFGCELKTKISHSLWPMCWMGDKQSLTEMAEYCAQDCNVLEQVYLKLRPLIKNHPHMGALADGNRSSCPNCGSTSYHANGTYATTSGLLYQRLRCNKCQASFKGWRVNK